MPQSAAFRVCSGTPVPWPRRGDALKDVGIPWVNTIAADRNGTGYYADISTVPNISQEQLVDCAESFSSPAETV